MGKRKNSTNDDEQLPGQMSILDLIEEEPQSFEDYIGKCRFCMWNGYGLYDQFGNRKKDAGSYNCQWEQTRHGITQCIDKSFWKPDIRTIPKLCGNCRHSNCFHYQIKPEYKENSAKAFSDPVEEPNIYCTRDDGSVNRTAPFERFTSKNFGACKWDRQHEWDSCEAWEQDRSVLEEDKG